ncbi:MAG: hypothetical protein GY869_23935, partial [Planctomycetes bacterium]|nr:hypothetical protein [Planctomycetota bacterium]
MSKIVPLMLLLCICLVAYPANQNIPDAPLSISQFNDPLINALYLQYIGDPNVAENKGPITTYDHLPAVLQTLINQPGSEPLDLLLETSSSLLSQPVRQLELTILFLPPVPAQIERDKLNSLLDQVDIYLNIVDPAVRDIDTFLDWYAGDDWSRRFGDTGFYHHIQQLKQNIVITRSETSYYRAMASFNWRQSTLNNIKQLTDSWKTLNDIVTSVKPDTDDSLLLTAQLYLNQARLARALALYQGSYFDEAQQAMQFLLDDTLPVEIVYETRLEALRFAGTAYPENTSLIRDESEKLRIWIEQNKNNLPDYPQKLFELAVLHASLPSQPGQLSLSAIKKLARDYPQLNSTISYLIGSYHSETLTQATDPVQIGSTMDDFDLLALAEYYRDQQPPRLQNLVNVYELFIKTRPATSPHYPRILYQAGLCSVQLAENDMLDQTLDMRFRQVLVAIDDWHQLALEFPTWMSQADPENINASQAASQAAALAYNLFAYDPNQFTDLALKVIPALVGKYEHGSVTFDGPFSESESAKNFRFYYALVLQSARRHAEAVEIFGTVPADDGNKTDAEYQVLACLFRQYQPADQSVDKPAEAIQILLDQALAFIEQHPASAYISDAQILVLQLYLQLDQIEPALQMIQNDMFDQLDNPRLSNLTLNLMQKQTPKLLELHAQNQKFELLSILNESLPLSQKICSVTTSAISLDSLSGSSLLAIRLYLEQLSLAAVTATDDPPNPNSRWSRQAQNWFLKLDNVPAFNRRLWYVRCHAIQDFAAGKYAAS